jgi:hypothetical protein
MVTTEIFGQLIGGCSESAWGRPMLESAARTAAKTVERFCVPMKRMDCGKRTPAVISSSFGDRDHAHGARDGTLFRGRPWTEPLEEDFRNRRRGYYETLYRGN